MMTKRTEDARTGAQDAEGTGRRYRSIAEIRRDFFPDAPASLFELRTGRTLREVTPRLTTQRPEH